MASPRLALAEAAASAQNVQQPQLDEARGRNAAKEARYLIQVEFDAEQVQAGEEEPRGDLFGAPGPVERFDALPVGGERMACECQLVVSKQVAQRLAVLPTHIPVQNQ